MAVLCIVLLPSACGGDDDGGSSVVDGGPGSSDGSGGSSDAGAIVMETEPNDGQEADLSDVDQLVVGGAVSGAIGTAGDVDVFFFDTEPGQLYRLTLVPPNQSELAAHLTVIDAGRGGEAPGLDFVKIDKAESGLTSSLEILAMGQGGYYAIVRDTRNVDDDAGVGSSSHSYLLSVEQRQIEAGGVTFPSNMSGTLDTSGSVDLYSFTGTEGDDVLFDFDTGGDIDGRMWIYAEATGDWIARNDDRAQGDLDPLIDAPLTESGSMYLVVENIEPGATTRTYTVNAQMP